MKGIIYIKYDIKILILNFIMIIFRYYNYYFFKDKMKIVEKINKYYLIIYKNIPIKEFSLQIILKI